MKPWRRTGSEDEIKHFDRVLACASKLIASGQDVGPQQAVMLAVLIVDLFSPVKEADEEKA